MSDFMYLYLKHIFIIYFVFYVKMYDLQLTKIKVYTVLGIFKLSCTTSNEKNISI